MAAVREAGEASGHGITYQAAVKSYRYDGDKLIVSVVHNHDANAQSGQEEEEHEVDLLVACDGRYSKVREQVDLCLLYTSPSPRDGLLSRMPSSA